MTEWTPKKLAEYFANHRCRNCQRIEKPDGTIETHHRAGERILITIDTLPELSEEEFDAELARRLLKARENAGLNIEDLALQAGIAPNTIKRYERLARRWPDIGTSKQNFWPPSKTIIVKVVQALGLSYDELFEGLRLAK